MKFSISVLLILIPYFCFAQQDSATVLHNHVWKPLYKKHSVTATVSLGLLDDFRRNYTLPSGFQKNNTSGFAPVYVKLEYGLTGHMSIAGTFSYDAFVYNFKQEYSGNNGPFTRYRNNKTRIFSGGVALFYHLDKFIHISHVDPFLGIGISLNNIRYNAFPQGDSTLIKIDHTVTPYVKLGARYYISERFSLFGDLGYDKQSIISLGFSTRFYHRKHTVKDAK